MMLKLPPPALSLKGPQKVRDFSEKWAKDQLYCPQCLGSLQPLKGSAPLQDFECQCRQLPFQLKSKSSSFVTKFRGADYKLTSNAVEQGVHPVLLLIHYDRHTRIVQNVLAVPGNSLTKDCIEKDLKPVTGRPGKFLCNFKLPEIFRGGRVPIVSYGNVIPEKTVQTLWKAGTSFVNVASSLKGWEHDVVRLIDELGTTFTLSDVYDQLPRLRGKYPQNRNADAKTRQILQRLRDAGLITFMRPGYYERN